MEAISAQIKENRPYLSDSSIKSYTSLLSNFYRKMTQGEDDYENAKAFFKNSQKLVLEEIKTMPLMRRKNTISAIVVLIGEKPERVVKRYREYMAEDIEKYEKQVEEQEKTAKQKENWLTQDEVNKVYQDIEEDVAHLLEKDAMSLTNRDRRNLVNYILMAILTKLPPRRSMDYTEMKLRNFDTSEDNYYKNGKFYFNKYKTAKTYGLQTVKLPNDLKKLIEKWSDAHDNDYMIFDSYGKKLTSPKLTAILNNIFGRKISTTMLRHIFLSDMLKDAPKLTEMKEVAESMAHSLEHQQKYRKV